MIKINIQFFGGRGSASGKGNGRGRAGKISTLVQSGMSRVDAERYISNENKADSLERELLQEMSSSETNHSTGWRRDIQDRINSLREENRRIRYSKH